MVSEIVLQNVILAIPICQDENGVELMHPILIHPPSSSRPNKGFMIS